MINFLFGLFTPTEFIYLKPVKLSKFIIDPLLKMNNALYNPRNPVTHQPYRIPFNMVVYTCIIASIGIIVYLVVKYITDLTIKNTVLQKHNTEINEQIELLKKHTIEMDERIALLHKTDEKNNEQIALLKTIDCINTEKVDLLKTQHTEMDEQIELLRQNDDKNNDTIELLKKYNTKNDDEIELLRTNNTKNNEQIELLKPQLTELNTQNNEMIKRYDTTIRELSDLVGSFVEKNEISTKIQTTVLNITKYFEFFDKIRISIGDQRFKKLFVRSVLINGLYPKDLRRYIFIADLGLTGQIHLNPFTHTPILMKYFGKYYHEGDDKFYPLQYKAWGGIGENSPREFAKSHLDFTQRMTNGFVNEISIEGLTTFYLNSEIPLLNRGIVHLLHETDEEFELKILRHVLIKLEDVYLAYKQYEMIGIKEDLKLPF